MSVGKIIKRRSSSGLIREGQRGFERTLKRVTIVNGQRNSSRLRERRARKNMGGGEGGRRGKEPPEMLRSQRGKSRLA